MAVSAVALAGRTLCGRAAAFADGQGVGLKLPRLCEGPVEAAPSAGELTAPGVAALPTDLPVACLPICLSTPTGLTTTSPPLCSLEEGTGVHRAPGRTRCVRPAGEPQGSREGRLASPGDSGELGTYEEFV
ncbi:hypothetical protein GCM10017687_48260 [Streptomyces echinatus]